VEAMAAVADAIALASSTKRTEEKLDLEAQTGALRGDERRRARARRGRTIPEEVASASPFAVRARRGTARQTLHGSSRQSRRTCSWVGIRRALGRQTVHVEYSLTMGGRGGFRRTSRRWKSVLWAIRDITERKEIEALRTSGRGSAPWFRTPRTRSRWSANNTILYEPSDEGYSARGAGVGTGVLTTSGRRERRTFASILNSPGGGMPVGTGSGTRTAPGVT